MFFLNTSSRLFYFYNTKVDKPKTEMRYPVLTSVIGLFIGFLSLKFE